jgi:tricarballylate dehydrogenase
MADLSCDVLVVGAGNAALCAALSARAAGASVMVLERAPEDERGGNSRFTEGSMRFAFNGRDDILKVVPDLTDDEKAITDFGSYTEEQFFDDIARVTDYRSDPDLAELLVKRSYETVMWLRSMGIRYMPKYGKQAYKVNGRFTFSGGVVLEVWGGGPGLIEALYKLARDRGVAIHFNARALNLLYDDTGVHGARARIDGKTVDIRSRSVVLACGGFEANSEMRARYLGPGWDLAKVRGTRFNTGDGIRMALDASAMPYGNWSGCHILPTDINTPNYGDITLGDAFQKNSYLFGIMVNSSGQRFFDEGADFRMYTYVKCGLAVMKQPQQLAWRAVPGHRARIQRRGASLRSVRSQQPRRPLDARTGGQQIELGNHARSAAVRSVYDHRRHHVHVRRHQGQYRRAGHGRRRPADSRPLRGGRNGRRLVLHQLPGRQRPHVGRGVRQDRR